MNLLIVFVLFFGFNSSLLIPSKKSYTISFDQAVLLNSTYVPDFYNISKFRVSKFNRTTYVFNLEADIFMDLDESVSIEIEFYYSRFGNNQYEKSPLGVPQKSFCAFMKQQYRSLFMEGLKNVSNFPQTDEIEKSCSLKKVNHVYFMKICQILYILFHFSFHRKSIG